MTFMTIEEEAVIAAAIAEYRYIRRTSSWDGLPGVLAWVEAGETEAERVRREVGVRVEVMEQSEKAARRVDDAVGALLERRERAVTERTERGYETVGEEHAIDDRMRVYVMGEWVAVSIELPDIGIRRARALDPESARQLAALLVKLADQAETAAPHVNAAE